MINYLLLTVCRKDKNNEKEVANGPFLAKKSVLAGSGGGNFVKLSNLDKNHAQFVVLKDLARVLMF